MLYSFRLTLRLISAVISGAGTGVYYWLTTKQSNWWTIVSSIATNVIINLYFGALLIDLPRQNVKTKNLFEQLNRERSPSSLSKIALASAKKSTQVFLGGIASIPESIVAMKREEQSMFWAGASGVAVFSSAFPLHTVPLDNMFILPHKMKIYAQNNKQAKFLYWLYDLLGKLKHIDHEKLKALLGSNQNIEEIIFELNAHTIPVKSRHEWLSSHRWLAQLAGHAGKGASLLFATYVTYFGVAPACEAAINLTNWFGLNFIFTSVLSQLFQMPLNWLAMEAGYYLLENVFSRFKSMFQYGLKHGVTNDDGFGATNRFGFSACFFLRWLLIAGGSVLSLESGYITEFLFKECPVSLGVELAAPSTVIFNLYYIFMTLTGTLGSLMAFTSKNISEYQMIGNSLEHLIDFFERRSNKEFDRTYNALPAAIRVAFEQTYMQGDETTPLLSSEAGESSKTEPEPKL